MNIGRVAIIGGAGFIGQNLVRKLLTCDKSTQITVLDNNQHQTAHFLPSNDERLRYLVIDVLDRKETENFFSNNRIDVVVNLSARAGVTESIANPRTNFETNVVGNFNLLDSARLYGVKKFIFASTGGAIMGDAEPPLTESMRPNPLTPYGVSKLTGELYTKVFEQCYSINSCCLRFSNVYGEYSIHKNNLIPAFLKSAFDRATACLYGDGGQARDFIYVGDLTEGIARVIDRNATGVIQLATGVSTTALGVVKLIEERLPPDIRIHWENKPVRKGEVYRTWCDNSKSVGLLGDYVSTPLTKGISKTVDWYVKYYGDRSTK